MGELIYLWDSNGISELIIGRWEVTRLIIHGLAGPAGGSATEDEKKVQFQHPAWSTSSSSSSSSSSSCFFCTQITTQIRQVFKQLLKSLLIEDVTFYFAQDKKDKTSQ